MDPAPRQVGIGVRLPAGDKCWAHAHGNDLQAALKRLGEDGRLDARGVPISKDLLHQLLAAVPTMNTATRSWQALGSTGRPSRATPCSTR